MIPLSTWVPNYYRPLHSRWRNRGEVHTINFGEHRAREFLLHWASSVLNSFIHSTNDSTSFSSSTVISFVTTLFLQGRHLRPTIVWNVRGRPQRLIELQERSVRTEREESRRPISLWQFQTARWRERSLQPTLLETPQGFDWRLRAQEEIQGQRFFRRNSTNTFVLTNTFSVAKRKFRNPQLNRFSTQLAQLNLYRLTDCHSLFLSISLSLYYPCIHINTLPLPFACLPPPSPPTLLA